jgi:uncharacterized iron-regulated membrane protein
MEQPLMLALRLLTLIALLVGAVRLWRRNPPTAREQRGLVGATVVTLLIVGATIAVASL